jgi:hypothetical protein
MFARVTNYSLFDIDVFSLCAHFIWFDRYPHKFREHNLIGTVIIVRIIYNRVSAKYLSKPKYSNPLPPTTMLF